MVPRQHPVYAPRSHGPTPSIYCSRRACPYIEAVITAAPSVADGTEAPSFTWRARFGVCGWLALPNIHQIFGDNAAEFPRFTRDKACVFSS
jgi:hypothetical protein